MNAMTKAEGKAEAVEIEARDAAPGGALAPATRPVPRGRRKGLRLFLMVLVPTALVIAGGYYWIMGGRFQETENAYLHQPKVSIASQAAGRIVEVNIQDNAKVSAGDILFVVDQEPYRIALEQAEAALAAARLNVEQLRAAYSQAVAQERVAASEVEYLEAELKRQQELSGKGISSRSSLDTAMRDVAKARESHAAAQQAVAGALAALGGSADLETDKHPSVLQALAARDKAAYELSQTTVRAPADGIVSQASSFKVGQFVGVGTPLFSLVETGQSWVEANFKETQLTHMRAGQKAEVIFDTYPDHPVEATVQSIGAGTGAEFSLLPAQNATGNWVKVTQRIPVRLTLEDENAKDLLRTGMSATVTVDTEASRGLGAIFGTANAAE
ncbi:membrane fusion protein (multidrug efflux system) [Mesorhizobium sp. J18]|uniref:HlyD family secretion protein n=1 Tax=Mesorhizobium sp. J18 TaxID=935263 RepID=UPI00119C0889|nr:HlyD family secretion protein [Mesorhizobium sp. J18]TWG91372.1 membrane fusion protein (multidrug efflux system) [Mesorhizobium sp. J18]